MTSEDRRRELGRWAEDLPVPAAVVSAEAAFIWRNPRWMELDPIQGVPFVWPLDFLQRLSDCLRGQHTHVIRALEHRTAERLYDLWIGPVGTEEGRLWLIAEEVTLYEEAALEDMVERRIREASVFVQGILHETRNPLAGIQATVQLLQRNPRIAPERHLGQILNDIGRIDAVLQELTLLAGPLRLHRRPANLHALIDEALGNLRGMMVEGDVGIRRDFDPSLPEVEIDPDRLYRVYLNLLRNALEASPEGAKIEIQTRAETDRRTGRSAWVTRIRDAGRGIGEDARPFLFAPLFTTKPAGTGLGLAVSQQIVQAHGGVLSLRNRPERGAEATVMLPMDSKEREETP